MPFLPSLLYLPLNDPGVSANFGGRKLFESSKPHLFHSICWSNSMRQRRTVGRIDIGAPIEDCDPSTWAENALDLAENCITILKLMPDVGQEDERAGGVRNLRSVALCTDRLDVRDSR